MVSKLLMAMCAVCFVVYVFIDTLSYRFFMSDCYTCAAIFLGDTQWLVSVLRGSGAHIGRNVILNDFYNLVDLQLIYFI